MSNTAAAAYPQTITFFCAHKDRLDACHSFYGGLLGLPLVLQMDAVRLYQVSSASFFGLTARPGRKPAPGGAIIELQTSGRTEVDRLYRLLTEAKVQTDGPPRELADPGAYFFFATDPQGYEVEIMFMPLLQSLAAKVAAAPR